MKEIKMNKKDKLIEIRNKLHESIPSGEDNEFVILFDLLVAINNHIEQLDKFINEEC